VSHRRERPGRAGRLRPRAVCTAGPTGYRGGVTPHVDVDRLVPEAQELARTAVRLVEQRTLDDVPAVLAGLAHGDHELLAQATVVALEGSRSQRSWIIAVELLQRATAIASAVDGRRDRALAPGRDVRTGRRRATASRTRHRLGGGRGDICTAT
jgi:hypothetical protein